MPRLKMAPKKVRRNTASILARIQCMPNGWVQGACDYALSRNTVSALRQRGLIGEVERDPMDDPRLKRWKLTPYGMEALREHNIWKVSFPCALDELVPVPGFRLAEAAAIAPDAPKTP